MKIRGVVAALALALAGSSPAKAWMSGEQFKEVCGAPDQTELSGIALGYVLGVIDAMEISAASYPLDANRRVRFCIPEHVQNGQIRDLVCQQIGNQPTEHLQPYGVAIINVALQKTFPCVE